MISKDICIDILLERYPDSKAYFSRFEQVETRDEFEENVEPPERRSIHGEMCEFSSYVKDLLEKDTNPEYIKNIFEFIEILLTEGDEDVQNAAATCFLENILNVTPGDIEPHTFVPYLGKESREYCKGWDEFTGVYTQGLWDELPPST